MGVFRRSEGFRMSKRHLKRASLVAASALLSAGLGLAAAAYSDAAPAGPARTTVADVAQPTCPPDGTTNAEYVGPCPS